MMHPTAVIHDKAVIGNNVNIGAYSVIEEKVKIADNVEILPYVHIKGNTDIAEGTKIHTGAVIGQASQMLGMRDTKGRITIGKNNIIREYVTINAPVSKEGLTSIGDNNFLMAFSHIAHDCNIASRVVICNGVLIAGHSKINDNVFISGNVVIHQFVRVGRLAMIGGLARVNQDVPAFMMVIGNSSVWGINSVGLKRAGFSRADFKNIKEIYNILYRQNLSFRSALAKIEKNNSGIAKEITEFIKSSDRGICSGKKNGFFEKVFLEYPYFLRTKIPAYIFFNKNFKR